MPSLPLQAQLGLQQSLRMTSDQWRLLGLGEKRNKPVAGGSTTTSLCCSESGRESEDGGENLELEE